MKTEILIVTYHRDAAYLSMCLASLERYASGFSGVTCVFPKQDDAIIRPLCNYYNATSIVFEERRDKGHLHHMIQKCRADQHCPNADLIAHVDSDCIYTETVTPEDYLEDAKPILLIRSYESIKGAVPWKAIVDSSMKMDCKYETMQRHPAVHWRGIYGDLRKHVERCHNQSFDDYLLSLKNDYPPGFSEFNSLGQIVLSTQWKSQYKLHDLDKLPHPKSKLVQFWSRSPVDMPQQVWHEGLQKTLVPSEFFSDHV